jgi:hypothetical protein
MDPSYSLKLEWTCIANEYADVPFAATGRAAERSGNRAARAAHGSCGNKAAAATPPRKLRLDTLEPTLSGPPPG